MNKTIINDPYFRVEMIRCTQNPQQLIWYSMHQDHSSEYVTDEINKKGELMNEKKGGEKAVEKALKYHHDGILEHPQISFNCGYFPHTVMVQGRTHRHTTWDCQSMRYTSQHILDVASGKRNVEEVFYLRPAGFYRDRKGKKYSYSHLHREKDLEYCENACLYYSKKIEQGMSEEHCRDVIPQNIRQHFFVSMNARALFHFINLRIKKDAQLEIQTLAEMMAIRAVEWMPEISEYMFTKVIKLPEEQKNRILNYDLK
jgi:thymidylate synthase (FAD)